MYAKGTAKEFLSIQASKIQDVTRSEAICAMTTPYGEIVSLSFSKVSYKLLVTAKPTGVEEFDDSDGEPANRPTGRRRPYEEQLAADIKKVIKASKEAHRLQQQTGDSSEGASIIPEVPDELTGKFTTLLEGAEDDSHQSDDEHVNEGDITWLSIDEEEKGNEDDDDEDDDRSIDIEETDDERTDSEYGDQGMTDADKIIADKLEEEKGDEEVEQANDDQAQEDQVKDYIVGTLVTMSQKEKPEVPRSSSSRSLSSNYGNQFLNVSFDTSLVSIIKDHTDTEINLLLDIPIQQEIPHDLSTPLLDVLVSVIPPPTTATPTPLITLLPTPPITSEAPPTPILTTTTTTEVPVHLVYEFKALTETLQRLSSLEKEVDKQKKVNQ
ncbi:hypothetical protein Tco_0600937, partial [Tanacetum coccineum]